MWSKVTPAISQRETLRDEAITAPSAMQEHGCSQAKWLSINIWEVCRCGSPHQPLEKVHGLVGLTRSPVEPPPTKVMKHNRAQI